MIQCDMRGAKPLYFIQVYNKKCTLLNVYC